MNGSYGDYYTTKGQGSQESYDAYYDEYGDSSVWQHVNVDTLGNIATTRMGGSRDFVTTHDSIQEIIGIEKDNNIFHIIIIGFLLYRVM
jgi:hypothetical protein